MAEPGSFEFQENILLFRILVTQWPSSSDFARIFWSNLVLSFRRIFCFSEF
jgi:hypothetical protein